MGNPYVVSAELDLANPVLERVIDFSKVDNFRQSLDDSLRRVGKDTVWVPSKVLREGMSMLLAQTKLPVVSLEDRYGSSAFSVLNIGISRCVDEDLNDIGYSARGGSEPLQEQIERISTLGDEVVIADDVLYSGGMIEWLAGSFAERGVKIGGVICGIAIQEGIDRLTSINIDVETVIAFNTVDDEICERDFAMVPGSGRRIASLNSNALYFDSENGKPSAWASIPEEMKQEFATSSYSRSAQLIRPGVNIEDIGNFKGWFGQVEARDALDEAAMWSIARESGVPPIF